jgi:hypothetical protein
MPAPHCGRNLRRDSDSRGNNTQRVSDYAQDQPDHDKNIAEAMARFNYWLMPQMRRVLLGKGEVCCGLTVVVACGRRAIGFIDSLVNSTNRDTRRHRALTVSTARPRVWARPKPAQPDNSRPTQRGASNRLAPTGQFVLIVTYCAGGTQGDSR